MKNLKSLSILIAIASSAVANAQNPFVSEILWNPTGADTNFEFVELQGTAGASVSNLYLISVEGDGNGAGSVTSSIAIPSFNFGTNGLALIRESANAISPSPDPATTVVVPTWQTFQNGSNTFLVVQSALAVWATGTDIDTNNDGAVDVQLPAGAVVWGAVGNSDTGSADKTYGAAFGGVDLIPAVGTFPLEAAYNVLNGAGTAPLAWVGGRMSNQNGGASAGPYLFFDPNFSNVPGLTLAELPGLNPGFKNLQFSGVPTISGNLVLQNTGDDGVAGTETITWTLSNGINSYTSDFTVDDFGGGAYSFNIPSGAANGAYTLSFDGGTFLKSTFNVTLSGSSLTQAVSLRNGDIDNDAEVGPSDFEAVVSQFGAAGDADVDNDGEVGPSDFETIVANFGLGDN